MQIEGNISLKRYNSFGIEAKAKHFVRLKNLNDLDEVFYDSAIAGNNPFILGGGSNILLTRDINRLVIKNELKGVEVTEDEDFFYIKAGAGENWHQLAMFSVSKGYAGMENLALIPGNVGATPMQNIGAYGVEIKDIFHELDAYHIGTKSFKKFSLDECEFGYRESVFKTKYKDQFIITSVTYRLKKTPGFNISYGAIQQELEKMKVEELSAQAIAQAVINIRSSKLPDPAVVGNAGSFFKNPTIAKSELESLKTMFPTIPSFPFDDEKVKLPAGWLIEQCGWKGFRNGDAGCYEKQALVLVNFGKATGKEIFNLSEQILQSVKEKFGVILEREVNII